MVDVLKGPEVSTALVVPLSPTGQPMSKATGCLLRWANRLLLLTNWHVVTGKRWASLTERSHPEWDGPYWAGNNAFTPAALRVSLRLHGRLQELHTLALEQPAGTDATLEPARVPWEPESTLLYGYFPMPNADLVCLELADSIAEQEERIAYTRNTHVRFGFTADDIGRRFDFQTSDPVFVVGFPAAFGSHAADPLVWTNGTVASDPHSQWDGPRFVIDSRTREGQSGSPVITYDRASRGLPERYQLVGIYSGRVDQKEDIGSVWPLEDLLNDLLKHGPRLQRVSGGPAAPGLLE